MPRDRQRVVLEHGPKISLSELPMSLGRDLNAVWHFSTGLKVELVLRFAGSSATIDLTHDGHTYRIVLEALAKPFGGRQWYFRCPSTGRRVTALWRPPGAARFASRHAWGRQVAYASQFLDPVGRAWATKRRIARRLGSTDPHDHELPPKPAWMRWPTYDRFAARYDNADEALEHLCAAAIGRWLAVTPTGAKA